MACSDRMDCSAVRTADRTADYAGNSSAAFTLIEMLVVLALTAIGAVAAHSWLIPSLQKHTLNGAASRVMESLNFARSESILLNQPVSLCPSAMHSTGTPRCQGDYVGGWMVFANPGRDAEFNADTDTVLRVYAPLPEGVTLTNRSGQRNASGVIHYLGNGASHRNQTLMLCFQAARQVGDRSIIVNIVGRPRLQSDWGVCPGTEA